MGRQVTVLVLLATLAAGTNLCMTYMWHLDQPIYWPAVSHYDNNTYQFAYESIQYTSQQGGHPEDNVYAIFGVNDRQDIYQYRADDSLNSVSGVPNFGAQMDYPGELVENVMSLANNNYDGYDQGWNSTYTGSRQRKTSGGFPQLDMIGFPYHHSLGPLVDPNAYWKELMTYQIVVENTFGSGVPISKGFFPAEMAFSERLIPNLVKAGYEWVIVSASHISRACPNYPYSIHGDNNTPPNPADQINPNQTNYYQMSISRGCVTQEAYPFSYTPHYAQHVDPSTGEVYKIIVIPSPQGMSWMDGYECYSTTDMNNVASSGNPEHPMLITLAHDGDNAYGGGYSYYMQCVSGLVNQANSEGYEPTTVQQYLSDFPVDEDDIIHVEDGAWVNADGDFGDPTFVNWNWPLFLANGTFNVPIGWSDKQRHYAIMTAAENWLETAEQVSGGVDMNQVQAPTSSATPAELAWHFMLPGLNSGFEYYGMGTEDMCLKDSLACNNAVYWAGVALANSYKDETPPSVWTPYRLPYNPGGYSMGSLTGYQYLLQPTDFYVYTFAYDVNGIQSLTLHVRTDNDGINPLTENYNEIYESNTEYVSQWTNYTMIYREFPTGNFYNWTGNCFQNMPFLPTYIANEYYYQVTGYTNVLLDYYISAIDSYSNVKSTDIFHVWVAGNSTQTEKPFLSFE